MRSSGGNPAGVAPHQKVGNSVIETNTFNEGTTTATVADTGDMIFLGKVKGRPEKAKSGS